MFWPEKPITESNWLAIGTLVQRDLFMQVGGFPEYPLYEDWALWVKCVQAGARIVKVPRAVYVYHQNSDSEHRKLWRDSRAQVEAHERVAAELGL